MFNKVLLKKFKRKGSKNKNKEFLSLKFVDLLNKDERRKYFKYLKVNIIISHCKRQDCIILVFDFDHFEYNHLRLLGIRIFCRWTYFVDKMGSHFSCRKQVNTKVIDNIQKGKQFDYLRLKGERVLSICEIYGMLVHKKYKTDAEK